MSARYIKRALKQFIYYTIIVLIILAIVYLTSNRSLEYQDLSFFEVINQGNSLYKMLGLLLLFSFVYPLIGYTKKEVAFKGSLQDNYSQILTTFSNRGFELCESAPTHNSNQEQILVFRKKSVLLRILRAFEDQVTLTYKGDSIAEIEGLRKEVLLIEAALVRL